MTDSELRAWLGEELAAGFSGWDFSRISATGRTQDFPLEWNYREELIGLMKQADSLLDLGTGGGEFLDQLPRLPADTKATEGWAPNLPIARRRLADKGVEVQPISDNLIPFADGRFGLVANRHESYVPAEVARVLRPGGTFITQQVGGLNKADINLALGGPPMPYGAWCLATAVAGLEAAHFRILSQSECLTKSRFFDTGAIVWYLKCIPWQIPDFDLDRYFDRLKHLQQRIEREGYVDFIQHCFRIIAQKPGATA